MLWLLLGAVLTSGRASAAAPLAASVPPLHPRFATVDAASPTVQQGCTELGTANECFSPLAGAYLNVGAFFDSNRSSNSAQFFLKLFRNESPDSLRLTGMGFHARTTNEPAIFQAAGAIIMGQELVFPREDALLNLNAVSILAAPPFEMTCVPFEEAIDTKGRRARPVLGPGDVAWIALRWPELAEEVDLEIGVDTDAIDLDCDFMTQDTGEHWYRPDPRSVPQYDWGITVFTAAVASRTDSAPPTWTLVKALYR